MDENKDALLRLMYQCLLTASSTWEDETICIKYFKDQLERLGVIDG